MNVEIDWDSEELGAGLRCYRAAQFFEAHEHWESVWLVASNPEKEFLQALIQVAAAFHHLQRGNAKGMRSLLATAQKRLANRTRYFGGVNVAILRHDIQEWLDRPEVDCELSEFTVPRIELVNESGGKT
jgi:predicted metal-dependent hydrolase